MSAGQVHAALADLRAESGRHDRNVLQQCTVRQHGIQRHLRIIVRPEPDVIFDRGIHDEGLLRHVGIARPHIIGNARSDNTAPLRNLNADEGA